MTAPRTDPQSTVPVEPLSAKEERTLRRLAAVVQPGDNAFGDTTVQRLLATLDAARASQPITATAGLRLAVERLKYWTDGGRRECWCPPDWDHGYHTDSCLVVQAAVAEYDAALAVADEAAMTAFYTAPASPSEAATGRVRTWSDLTDAERDHWRSLAAPPVREDEPTGIDVERLAKAVIVTNLGTDFGRTGVAAKDYAARLAAEYDRLTREASHVR